jgi:serine/threonine protein kinase
LKLENILLADKESKKVKIVDFGIAGMATNLDVSKIGAGSLKYMAPELFTHKLKKIGPHIDIWALGVILYSLVFGQLPFDGPN